MTKTVGPRRYLGLTGGPSMSVFAAQPDGQVSSVEWSGTRVGVGVLSEGARVVWSERLVLPQVDGESFGVERSGLMVKAGGDEVLPSACAGQAKLRARAGDAVLPGPRGSVGQAKLRAGAGGAVLPGEDGPAGWMRLRAAADDGAVLPGVRGGAAIPLTGGKFGWAAMPVPLMPVFAARASGVEGKP